MSIRSGGSKYLTNLLDFELDQEWTNKMEIVNNHFLDKQLDFINQGLAMENIIKMAVKNNKYDELNKIRIRQKIQAIEFCEKYDIPMNKKIKISNADVYIAPFAIEA